MKTKYITIIFTLLLTLSMGCKKFVEVGPPKTETVFSEAFKQDASATSVVLGIYINMLSDFQFINSGITVYSGLAAGELETLTGRSEELEFQQNKLLPTNPLVSSMWQSAYKNIVLINSCIQGLEQSTTLSPAVKQQLLGECRFSRAFINFYLVNLWGNVPLVTSTDYRENTAIGQSSPDQVYNAIISDLKQSQTELKEAYPTEGKVRPNKWTATALLARVYLYKKDYTNAAAEASSVIGSGSYNPLDDLSSKFLKGSNEAIWQLLPSKTLVLATQEGYTFIGDIPYGSAPNYVISSGLLDSFDDNDNRKINWIDSVHYQGTPYYYPYKYKDRGDYFADPTEYYIMLRLSEQYLIRAEARAQLGDLAGSADDLNEIRAKAGLDPIADVLTIIDKNSLLQAIQTENRHEFFTEWGHRWLDQKRTATQAPTSALFPIPQDQLNLSRKLIQNPGY